MMLRALVFTMLAPVSQVTFARNFVADVLTSMPKIFTDIEYTACLYITGQAFDHSWNHTTMKFEREDPQCVDVQANELFHTVKLLLSVFPFWIRLMQSLRSYHDSKSRKHLFNALKYCTSLSTVLLSFVHGKWTALWVVMSVVSTAYTFTWDVLLDWGLGPDFIRRALHGDEFGSVSSWCMLRPVRLYPRWVYYFAIGFDFVAKFGWAINISPGQRVMKQHAVLLLGCLELLRRAQWAMLRLEWEDIHRSFQDGNIPRRELLQEVLASTSNSFSTLTELRMSRQNTENVAIEQCQSHSSNDVFKDEEDGRKQILLETVVSDVQVGHAHQSCTGM
jgi:hypothetical protein